MELGGATPIDTYYEFIGYRLGAAIAGQILWDSVFVALVILSGIIRLYWTSVIKGDFHKMFVYPLYVGILLLLFSPIEVTVGVETVWDPKLVAQGESADRNMDRAAFYQSSDVYDRARTLEVPAILALAHNLSDGLLFTLSDTTHEGAKNSIFEWDRVAAASLQATILDAQLRTRFTTFLNSCYWPAVAAKEIDGTHHLPIIDDEILQPAYSKSCQQRDMGLSTALLDHIESDPVHRRIVEAYRGAVDHEGGARIVRDNLGEGNQFVTHYLRRMIWNETYGPAARNEMALVARAMPNYSVFDAEDREKFVATSGNLASELLAGFSGISEMIEQESLGPMLYYRMTLFAPYLYGLILAFLIMVFPIVALMTLWPGWGKALVHFFTIWMSVKLWPVFWSWLSGINGGRMMSAYSDDPRGLVGTGGAGAMFTALAAMYVLVPGLSYLIMHIATSLGQTGIQQFLRGGSTGNPVTGAARMIRTGYGSAEAVARRVYRWNKSRGGDDRSQGSGGSGTSGQSSGSGGGGAGLREN